MSVLWAPCGASLRLLGTTRGGRARRLRGGKVTKMSDGEPFQAVFSTQRFASSHCRVSQAPVSPMCPPGVEPRTNLSPETVTVPIDEDSSDQAEPEHGGCPPVPGSASRCSRRTRRSHRGPRGRSSGGMLEREVSCPTRTTESAPRWRRRSSVRHESRLKRVPMMAEPGVDGDAHEARDGNSRRPVGERGAVGRYRHPDDAAADEKRRESGSPASGR